MAKLACPQCGRNFATQFGLQKHDCTNNGTPVDSEEAKRHTYFAAIYDKLVPQVSELLLLATEKAAPGDGSLKMMVLQGICANVILASRRDNKTEHMTGLVEVFTDSLTRQMYETLKHIQLMEASNANPKGS